MTKHTKRRTPETTTVKAGKKTIYRHCPCGETAFDLTIVRGEGGGRWAYACRNCMTPRFTPDALAIKPVAPEPAESEPAESEPQ